MKHTESRINKAFNELLSEKPYNKITVKNIIERCGVNRGTFYYHYQDIPSLLKDLSKRHADAIISQISECRQPMDFVLPLMFYCVAHRNILLNIYHSMPSPDFFETVLEFHQYYVDKMIGHVIKDQRGILMKRDIMVNHLSYYLTGMSIDWLNHDLSESYIEDMVLSNEMFKNVEWGL